MLSSSRTVFVAFLLVLLYPSTFNAQDACVALLKHGIYATHTTQSSAQSYQSFKANFCSWYSSYRQSHSSEGASITIPIADIPIGLSGHMTYGEADALQKGVCSAQSMNTSTDQMWNDVAQFIDPNGAAAFSACVNALRTGLSIDAQINDDETQAVIAMAYTAVGGTPQTVNFLSIDGWNCPKPTNGGLDLNSIVGKPKQLTSSQMSISCTRDVKQQPFLYNGLQVTAKEAKISIATSAGTYTRFFLAKVYADPLADTAKVLASYPKGTILPFAGQKTDIPAGWHICDGTGGTIKLVGRIPYGASGDTEIGAIAGQASFPLSISGTTAGPKNGLNKNALQGGAGFEAAGNNHQHDFNVKTINIPLLPEVTKLYFIQKVQ